MVMHDSFEYAIDQFGSLWAYTKVAPSGAPHPTVFNPGGEEKWEPDTPVLPVFTVPDVSIYYPPFHISIRAPERLFWGLPAFFVYNKHLDALKRVRWVRHIVTRIHSGDYPNTFRIQVLGYANRGQAAFENSRYTADVGIRFDRPRQPSKASAEWLMDLSNIRLLVPWLSRGVRGMERAYPKGSATVKVVSSGDFKLKAREYRDHVLKRMGPDPDDGTGAKISHDQGPWHDAGERWAWIVLRALQPPEVQDPWAFRGEFKWPDPR